MFTMIHAPVCRPPESRPRIAPPCPAPPPSSSLHLHAHPAPIHAPLCANPSNQASSCLIKATAIFSNHRQIGASTRWMGRTGRRMVKMCTQEKSSPGGEETGEGERPTKLSGRVIMPAAANQGKNPCNRAKSRLIKAAMKILLPTDSQPQPPSLPGIPPFATLRLCVKNPVIKSQSSLNQGKNPCNRASSRLIKANRKI